MNTTQISRARQSQLAAAFRAGRAAAAASGCEYDFQVANPYTGRDGMMPARFSSVECALWHAFAAGIRRQYGKIEGASTMLRNARFCMRRATELGRA